MGRKMGNKSTKKPNSTLIIIGGMIAVTLVIVILIVSMGAKSDKSATVNEPNGTMVEEESQDKTEIQTKTEASKEQPVEEPVEANMNKDGNGFNTGCDAYDELLGKIVLAIENEDDSENPDYSYVYGRFGKMSSSGFGYALIDINNDNKNELVIGENGTPEYPSILFDMYMMDDKNMVHVFSGGERDRYYATNIANAFTEEASSSAEDFFIDTFLVENGKRVSAEFYVEPKRINLTLIPFVETFDETIDKTIDEASDETFIPYSFIEERAKKNSFASTEEIIDNLAKGEGYAIAKMKNGEEIILIAEPDNICNIGNNSVSFSATPYYKTGKGYEYGNTPFVCEDENCSIKLTDDGDIICGGSDFIEKYELVNNDNRRGFGYKYSIRKDESGNSYSGFSTDFDTEKTTSIDEKNEGEKFFTEASEEYAAAEPVVFTVK